MCCILRAKRYTFNMLSKSDQMSKICLQGYKINQLYVLNLNLNEYWGSLGSDFIGLYIMDQNRWRVMSDPCERSAYAESFLIRLLVELDG